MIAVPTLGLIAGRSWWPKLHAAAPGVGGANLRDVTTYTLRKGDPATTRTDVVVVAVGRRGDAFRVAPGGEAVRDAYGRGFPALLRSAGFSGEEGSAASFWSTDKIRAGALVVVGIGAGDPTDPAVIRRAAGVAARNLGNAGSVALALPADDAATVRAVVEGFWSGGSTVRGTDRVPPAHVTVLSSAARRQDAVAAFETAQVVEELADLARAWTNAPANVLTPEEFVTRTRKLRRKAVSVRVYDREELASLGCGGILSVGDSSANPPYLVRLRYAPADPVARIALVGKGVTYDSGGLTIKPGGSMATMKLDMAGAAAVVAAVHAIAALGLPVEVVGWAPLAENMPSGTACRPGDVVRMYDGQTVEIANTDAEGRMLLGDAIGLAREDDPDAIVEISTLTGPCVTALGHKVAGLFGTPEQVDRVRAAAGSRGELVWHLPIPDHIARAVRGESKLADLLQHNWVRWGSASYAAAFLTAFAKDTPFAHLDIAGPAFNTGAAWGDVPTGGTGFGVRTLVQYVADLAEA